MNFHNRNMQNNNKQFNFIQNELNKYINKYNELKSEYNTLYSNYRELEKKKASIESKLDENTKIIKNYDNDKKDLENKKKNVEEIIKQYSNILDTNSKLNAENKKKQTDYDKLKVKYENLKKEKDDLQNECNNAKENLKIINNNYNKIQKELDCTNNLMKEKEKEINKLITNNKKADKTSKEMIDKYVSYIKQLENELNDIKLEAKSLYEQLLNKNQDIKSLNTQLEQNHSKFDGAIYQFEEMGKKLKKQDDEIKELSKIKEENEKLIEEKKKMNNTIKESETKKEYLEKAAEEFYDVVVDINSINSLKNEGWAIKYNKERKDIYDKIIGEETMKIGVLGLNNVGKSYLLSKIVKGNIPTGYSIETKGISIKYSKGNEGEEKGICILDSAGFETPLLKEKSKEEETSKEDNKEEKKSQLENALKYDEVEDDLSRDKAQTERFIEQLIISLSDMIILVIGKLTRTEQRLITRIKNMSKKNDKNKVKSIIIVHNLAQYHRKIEVENHISRYLLHSATFQLTSKDVIGMEKYSDRKYFVEETDDEDIKVYHYIMAKEGTEAGNYYNNLTLDLIKAKYNEFTKRRRINIPEQIINLFSELSTDILGEKMECQKLESDENIIKLADNQISDKKKANKIHVQNAYIDQDGNYLQNKGKFEPKYSLYFFKEKKKKGEEDDDDDDDEDSFDNYLLLRLEIPGNIVRLTARTTNPEKEKYKGIVIKGLKERDKFDEESKKDFTIIYDNRSYDEFSYFIELKRNLELSGSNANGNTNIYKIKFDKRNKEKVFSKETKNEPKKDDGKDKNNKIEEIASGVYIMKFKLTEISYILSK